MIARQIGVELRRLLAEYPVVTLLGPRQAGKTTLARGLLDDYEYSNLENPETRQLAEDDPKAFLTRFKGKVILDEIQRVPELLSYIQVIVDEKPGNGQFLLTGSHQLELRQAITQSLAGRTSILNLYPFSIEELAKAKITFDKPEEYIFNGFLPRIYDQGQRPTPAYSNYYQTYVERDVRQLIHLKDVSHFEKFIKLLAGRTGQLMDYSSLANDVGVSANTVKHWLSILEASFIVYKLPPYFENFGKRVVKSPKYYFMDTGLLAFLLGIERPEQVTRDPLVGQMFENLVVMECLKYRTNQGKIPNLYFFRDSTGNEVDLICQQGRELVAIEIKSSTTYRAELLKGLKRINAIAPRVSASHLIYAGERFEFSNGINALNYREISTIF
ncbi:MULTISPECIES: ATP-binding protein [unclassified Microbulbifer]|uniref:ATP-binding protein n=1 Tax=unclassified Microbulbifer TaxID=2619833 RepID=UPI0027E5204C|nr:MULTISPECIES: ATP-binding protein [unclassified Microbulbifer]